jgi:hypothetical protein
MPLNCPGYNKDVLSADGNGLGNGTTQAAADTEATQNAIIDAVTKVWSQWPSHQCLPPCVTIPMPRLVDSGANSTTPAGAKRCTSQGWAVAALDILCVWVPPPPAPPAPATPATPTLPGDIAPVHGGSKTQRP